MKENTFTGFLLTSAFDKQFDERLFFLIQQILIKNNISEDNCLRFLIMRTFIVVAIHLLISNFAH